MNNETENMLLSDTELFYGYLKPTDYAVHSKRIAGANFAAFKRNAPYVISANDTCSYAFRLAYDLYASGIDMTDGFTAQTVFTKYVHTTDPECIEAILHFFRYIQSA